MDDGEIFEATVFLHHFKDLTDTRQQAKVVYPLDEVLLLALLAQAGLAFEALNTVKPPCPTGPDIAQAVRTHRADCGIATRAVALSAGLDFIALTWERFDLTLRQRDYFMAGPQALFEFMRGAVFRERAAELGGYDTAESGRIRHVD